MTVVACAVLGSLHISHVSAFVNATCEDFELKEAWNVVSNGPKLKRRKTLYN